MTQEEIIKKFTEDLLKALSEGREVVFLKLADSKDLVMWSLYLK